MFRADSPAEAAQRSQQGLWELLISLPVVQRQQLQGSSSCWLSALLEAQAAPSRSQHHPGLAEPSLAVLESSHLPSSQNYFWESIFSLVLRLFEIFKTQKMSRMN